VFSGFQRRRCSSLRRNCRVWDLWRHRAARPKRGRRMDIWCRDMAGWCWCRRCVHQCGVHVTAVQGDRGVFVRAPVHEPGRRSDADGAEPRGDDAVVRNWRPRRFECRRADRDDYGRSPDVGDGKARRAAAMIPLDLTFVTGSAEKKLHFELVNHPKLTPLLVR